MGWRRKFELGLKSWSSGTSNWRRPEPGWPKRSCTLSAAKLIWLKRRDSATPAASAGVLLPEKSSGQRKGIELRDTTQGLSQRSTLYSNGFIRKTSASYKRRSIAPSEIGRASCRERV